MKIKVSESLENFAKLVSKKADMFVVGGYVRNYLLGISNSDVDLASRLTTQELIKLTQNTPYTVKEKNKQLGTCTITIGAEVWEHSTFRKEKYPNDGSHKPSKVTFITDMREDAKRRDFTVNAIYYNIIKDEIVDIYSGLYDLKKRRIRAIETPDYVFENDGLRILRMIRQACELNFKIQRETYLKAKQRVYRLKDISGTRKAYELDRILNSSNKFLPSKQNAHMRGLKMLNMMDIWPSFFAGVTHINYSLVKKTSQQNRLIGLLIDLINTINPDCVSYYLEYALGKDGLNFSKAEQKDIIFIVSGYFDALNGLNNKMFFTTTIHTLSALAKFCKKNLYSNIANTTFIINISTNSKFQQGLKTLKYLGKI